MGGTVSTDYLEYQAARVEGVLAAHRMPGRVTGGNAGPRMVCFFVALSPYVKVAQVQGLRKDLQMALQVPRLQVRTDKGQVVLEFDNPSPAFVSAARLFEEVGSLPFCTAVLGVGEDMELLTVRLSSADNPHSLVSGTTGSGKSNLLRVIAASLAVNNTPRLLQLLFIDPKGRTFEPFAGLPHLSRPPVENAAEAVEALHSLVRLLRSRDRDKFRPDFDGPRIVVLIDELADLVMQDSGIVDVVSQIVQTGRQTGIHVIAATQHPAAAILGGVMRQNFPLRLVGKVVSADDARVASGQSGTEAHLLGGRGAFLAVAGGNMARFQVPYQRDWSKVLGKVKYESVITQAFAIPTGKPELKLKPIERLPVLAPKTEPGERVKEALAVLRPVWEDMRDDWNKNKRGIKTEVVKLVWQDQRYEGSFAKWIEEAVDILEKERLEALN